MRIHCVLVNATTAAMTAAIALAASWAVADEPPSADQPQRSAEQMMVDAHVARATWEGLPGFTADLIVAENDRTARGSLRVTSEDELSVSLPDGFPWVERRLQSLVDHRQPSDLDFEVSFVNHQQEHPLGYLISIDDDALMGSRYRVEGDVIREVHRKMGDTKFTITVVDIHRNPEGKYLPKFYTVSFWDAETGQLKSTNVVRDQWVRVEKWDLPKRLLSVESAGESERNVRQIRLENHQLLDGHDSGQSHE